MLLYGALKRAYDCMDAWEAGVDRGERGDVRSGQEEGARRGGGAEEACRKRKAAAEGSAAMRRCAHAAHESNPMMRRES